MSGCALEDDTAVSLAPSKPQHRLARPIQATECIPQHACIPARSSRQPRAEAVLAHSCSTPRAGRSCGPPLPAAGLLPLWRYICIWDPSSLLMRRLAAWASQRRPGLSGGVEPPGPLCLPASGVHAAALGARPAPGAALVQRDQARLHHPAGARWGGAGQRPAQPASRRPCCSVPSAPEAQRVGCLRFGALCLFAGALPAQLGPSAAAGSGASDSPSQSQSRSIGSAAGPSSTATSTSAPAPSSEAASPLALPIAVGVAGAAMLLLLAAALLLLRRRAQSRSQGPGDGSVKASAAARCCPGPACSCQPVGFAQHCAVAAGLVHCQPHAAACRVWPAPSGVPAQHASRRPGL